MRSPILFCILAVLILFGSNAQAAASGDWLSAPKPNFPASALQKGLEGSVTLRLVLSKDGSVTSARISKTSGDPVLDATARDAVLKWKMKSSAVRPLDLTKGRQEIIEFRQEAMRSATYPLGVAAGFTGEQRWKQWVHAPFPYYPMDARRLHHTGMVMVSATIGRDGRVIDVRVVKSSGHNDLDELAENAIRHWQAHKEYAGHHLEVPVNFTIGGR